MDQGKLKLDSVPLTALDQLGRAMDDGTRLHGRFDWREVGTSDEYHYNAIMRHLLAWAGGEDLDIKTGRHHMAHIMSRAAIVIDATEGGMLARVLGKGWVGPRDKVEVAAHPERDITVGPEVTVHAEKGRTAGPEVMDAATVRLRAVQEYEAARAKFEAAEKALIAADKDVKAAWRSQKLSQAD